DLAIASYSHDGQEPLWDPDSWRHPRDADVSGVRERRDDDRDHADHGGAVTAHELWRFFGARDVHCAGDSAVDPRPSTRGGCRQEPSAGLIKAPPGMHRRSPRADQARTTTS